MKKSSDLALKMQRSHAPFAGILTTGIDQERRRSDLGPLKGFSSADCDV
jgi:hypothetical protein